MPETFILIPGRTSRQGTSLNEGKYTDNYRDEINTLRMNAEDMERLSLTAGERVRMWNEFGSVEVPVDKDKGECPPGLLFISYGDISSQLMGGETHGSGMPDSKALDVFVERIQYTKKKAFEVLPLRRLSQSKRETD
ncbi:molybdopterin dinucleotide binding domain-containing protein [Thalassoroseus pseudoceratinae]|uniref:molybdopterin dinucleotide binding domain-containing protein n=1 Tax=Thalassoroseus pseudoceratinae TaxID=2713176 RepID=UPI001423D40F|nr:molybdopterin dinucleotide binding domain-containing protein [Thalassoroseus pseudoceratinae]